MNLYDQIMGAFGIPGQSAAASAADTARAAASGAFGIPGQLSDYAPASTTVPVTVGPTASLPQEDAQVQRLPAPGWQRWLRIGLMVAGVILVGGYVFRYLRRKG